MASTSNILILASLLQDNEILKCTEEAQIQEINQLPPLNNYTTRTPPRRFLYDPTESVIRYAKPENPLFGAQEYQGLLSQKPYFTFIGIEVYLAS